MASYEDVVRQKYNKYGTSEDFNLGGEQPAEEAPAAPAAPAVEKKTATEKGSEAAIKASAAGGGAMDILNQGLIASGNPYAMAAGLGLSAANSIVQGRNQRAQDAYKAEVDKINKRQEAINRMSLIGQGLRA